MCGVALALVSVSLACTAPPPEPESLPDSEPASPSLMRFELRPDAEPLPPPPPPPPKPTKVPPKPTYFDEPVLLASSGEVWAVSNRESVWLAGADDQPHLVDRAPDAPFDAPPELPWITTIDIDEHGTLWLLEAGGRLLSTTAADEPLRERGVAPLREAGALEVRSDLLVVLGFVEDHVEWPNYKFETDSRRVLATRPLDRDDWTLHPTPWDGNMLDDMTVSAGGELLLFDGEEASCGGGGQHRWVSADGEHWTELLWPIDTPYERYAGVDGWSYGIDRWPEYEGDWHFVAVDREGEANGLFAASRAYEVGHDHGHTRVLTEDGLWAVEADKAERIAGPAPDVLGKHHRSGTIASSVDGRGRMMLLYDGTLHFGSADGWTTVRVW